MEASVPPRSSASSVLVRVLVPAAVLGGLLLVATGALGRAGASPVGEVLTGLAVAGVTTGVVALLRRRTWDGHAALGVVVPRAGRQAVAGALAWLLPAAAGFALLAALGVPLRAAAPPAELAAAVALTAVLVLLLEAWPEELVFRGHATAVLAERLRGWSVILGQTLLFAAFATALRGWSGAEDLGLFLAMGLGLGYLRAVTGGIWAGTGFHLAFQAVAQLVLPGELLVVEAPRLAVLLVLGTVPFAVGLGGLVLLAQWRPGLLGPGRAPGASPDTLDP
ncbi:CPBP family glutamic-type intramembrane protease [Kocuria nitroreducens]|uniref:CPBP family glutamic-type intramembrane protease n=1 Tax=Kocuria nitroreducens TaxID=3058914 RepID=UPI0036D87693